MQWASVLYRLTSLPGQYLASTPLLLKRQRSLSLTLSVTSANKSELITISDIAYCKGAGDYVELVLIAGKTVLHSDSLNELEQNLPPTFLRVHRSYIVNTALIASLQRKNSGTGVVALKNGDSVPVSRRIMPHVKERLIS